MNKKNIAIIGGGISGLVCANQLADTFNITLFEKARGVAGRTSTRYADMYEFDHGAVHITARTAQFQTFIQSLCEQNIVTQWNPKIETISLDKAAFKRAWFEPHYVGYSRMNDIAKYLLTKIADKHTIHIGTEIQSVEKTADKITLMDKKNTLYTDFDYLIITAPAPQVFNLLPVDVQYRESLKQVTMSPAYSLMIGTPDILPHQTSIYECHDSMIEKIIINSDKPNRKNTNTLSTDATSIMVQSTPEWSNTHVDVDIPAMQEILLNQTLQLLKMPNLKIDFITTHRWRYAKTQQYLNNPFLWDNHFNIGACGDWCHDETLEKTLDTQIQGVEAAYLSATALSGYLMR